MDLGLVLVVLGIVIALLVSHEIGVILIVVGAILLLIPFLQSLTIKR